MSPASTIAGTPTFRGSRRSATNAAAIDEEECPDGKDQSAGRRTMTEKPDSASNGRTRAKMFFSSRLTMRAFKASAAAIITPAFRVFLRASSPTVSSTQINPPFPRLVIKVIIPSSTGVRWACTQ